MVRSLGIALVLLVGARVVAGAEPPPSPEDAAAEVKAALDAKDAGRLAALAARDDPDPWLVADVLLRKHDRARAAAYAGAATRKATERLPAYIDKAEGEEADAAARAAWTAAADALAKKKPGDALAKLESATSITSPILKSQVQLTRGEALAALGRRGEAAKSFRASADTAREVGWHAHEAHALFHCGLQHNLDSRFAEALAAYTRRLEVETLLGSEIGMGRAHYGIATVHENQGDAAKERLHLDKARAHAETAGDSVYLGKVIAGEAGIRARARDLRGALELSDRALETFDAEPPRAPPARFRHDLEWVASTKARLLLNCATWSLRLRDIERVRACGARAETAALAGGDDTVLASARAHLAMLEGLWSELFQRDDLASLPHLERAAEQYGLAGLREEQADTLRRLGTIRGRLGDFVGGLAGLGRSLDVLVTVDSDRARKRLFHVHLQAAKLATQMGRTEAARGHAEAALGLARKRKDRASEADALGARARYQRARGEYARAIITFKEALRVQAEAKVTGNRGVLLLGLGMVQGEIGKEALALETIQEAIADLTERKDVANLQIARARTAALLRATGEHEEAAEILTELREEHSGRKERAREASVLARLANIRSEQQRYDEAIALLKEACAILEKLGDLRALVGARIELGRAQFRMMKNEEGLAAMTTARASAEELGSPSLLAWSALALAESHHQLGSWREALDWAEKGVEATRTLGLDLAEGQGAEARARFASLPEIGASAALHLKDAEKLHTFLELSRSATLLAALGGRKLLREATISDDLRKREDEARAAEALASAAFIAARRGGDFDAPQAAWAELKTARTALKHVVEEIETTARLQSDLAYPTIVQLDAVQRLLAPSDALVVYAKLRGDFVALVVTPKRKVKPKDGEKPPEDVRPVRLGSIDEIRAAVQAVFEDDEYRVNEAALVALRKKIAAPLGLGKEVERVLISPGGTVSYVPFSFVFDSREIVLVPSATGYALLRADDAKRKEKGEEVLAYGDPAYDPALRRTLPRLRSSEAEAVAVGDVVRVHKKASETNFLADVTARARWRAIHLACHGLVDAERPTLSSLALLPDGHNDGYLTALDVFRMKIPADLAVLSACNTGRGRLVEGEGIIGLTRAFMFAGSPRVIASLWKVDDEATGALMRRFYELWNPKKGTSTLSVAEALREAQAHVRAQKEWKHPEFWAAWVLWGLP